MHPAVVSARHAPSTQIARASHRAGSGEQLGGSQRRVGGAHRAFASLRMASSRRFVTASNGGAGSHSPQHVNDAGITAHSASCLHSAGAAIAGTMRSSSTSYSSTHEIQIVATTTASPAIVVRKRRPRERVRLACRASWLDHSWRRFHSDMSRCRAISVRGQLASATFSRIRSTRRS